MYVAIVKLHVVSLSILYDFRLKSGSVAVILLVDEERILFWWSLAIFPLLYILRDLFV